MRDWIDEMRELDELIYKKLNKDTRTIEEKNTSTYSNLLGCYVNTKTGEKLHDDGNVLCSGGWKKDDKTWKLEERTVLDSNGWVKE